MGLSLFDFYHDINERDLEFFKFDLMVKQEQIDNKALIRGSLLTLDCGSGTVGYQPNSTIFSLNHLTDLNYPF